MILKTEEGKAIDLSQGIDLSIPLSANPGGVSAWHVSPPKITPVEGDGWVGLVEKGGAVNFMDVVFNPHGNGTHTECLGHITPEVHSINQHLHQFFFRALLVSVHPEEIGEDQVITASCLPTLEEYKSIDALIIRTLPNSSDKKSKNYSSTNPAYFDISCLEIINKLGIKHLLVDLPSVDKERDGGKVAFHHAFWEVPENPRFDRTITELIYVPNEVKDGEYLLNLQVAPFEHDAAPSRPVIYRLF